MRIKIQIHPNTVADSQADGQDTSQAVIVLEFYSLSLSMLWRGCAEEYYGYDALLLAQPDTLNQLCPKRLHVVLDIDQTLVHSVDYHKDDKYYNTCHVIEVPMKSCVTTKLCVVLRPGLADFLRELSSVFEVSFCTVFDSAVSRVHPYV